MSTRKSRSFVNRSRERIKAARLEEQLFQFIAGEIEMSRTQVYAATKLLDKVLPSLKAVSIEEIEPASKRPRNMTRAELTARLGEWKTEGRGASIEERGYIHKDDLEAMGYVRVEQLP
jgi:hypothetical protein